MTAQRRRVAEPIRWRKASWALIADDRSIGWFAGIGVPLRYQAEAEARCARDRCPVADDHAAPHLDGTCGFHASSADPLAWMLPDLVLLDVELYGRVVRHERGWRAQRQRVLGVRFVRGCPDCQCLTDAPLLVTVPAPIGDRGWMVTPRCRRCAAIWRSPSSGWPIAPAQLAGLLGTEVCWADETTTAEVMRREAARKGRRRGGVRPHQ